MPFVGAGISVAARVPGSDLEPTVGCMAGALRQAIQGCLDDCRESATDPDPAAPWVLRPPAHPRGPECATVRALLAQTGPMALSQLAEIGQLLWGANAVCQTLRIDEFAALEPLPAHRYLAYLAREGLITEIISTNYDCCIERAYRRSLGPDLCPNPNDLDGVTPAVIRNLDEYRAKANRRGGWTQGICRPILRLYKINGCADAYRDARRDAERHNGREYDEALARQAERIILTERQLQSFRKENWALDLFRDRARTRNLLFCGFGSEEPQVRHAALSITQEFQNCRLPVPADEAASLPNAPWVAAYEQLQFYQVQILTGFVHAHAGATVTGPPLACQVAALLHNVFLGPDACALGGETPKLTADLFLQALYERTFSALLRIELADDSRLAGWLRANAPDRWRLWLDCLFPLAAPAQTVGDGTAIVDRATGLDAGCKALLQPTGLNAPLRLWTWIWAMYKPATATQPPPLWYLPLTEDPLSILVPLLLASALAAKEQASDAGGTGAPGAQPLAPWWDGLRPVEQQGLEIPLAATASGMARAIYLVQEQALVPRTRRTAAAPQRLVRYLSVPSTRFAVDRLRIENPPREEGGIGTLYVGHRETLSAAELIRRARDPGRVAAVLAELFAASRVEPRVRLTRFQGSLVDSTESST